MKKALSLFLAIIITMSSMAVLSVSGFAKNNVAIHAEDALHTEGYKIVNAKGEDVFLKGLNLGGWLIMEDWFTPVANDATGDVYTYEVLEERFGTEKTYELLNIYQDNWIVETDFKNIADMGFNCVRIPFWYRNFQSDTEGTWILDDKGEIDLSRLEWAVEMCRKYGLYAILDLHAANGVQGYADHAGHKNSYHFFDQNEKGEWYRAQAVELWRVIAERFAGDPAIAMFDLLNEPMCDVPMAKRIHSYIWEYYDMAYDAIRKEDPDRMITMIGTWSVDKLPDPDEYGWENVVYQYHQYDKKESDYTTRIANGWACFYNVPQYAGEFHPVGDKVTLDFAIDAYDSNDIVWTLWTYKGYNSWAAWADWFCYGSTSDEYIVDLHNDSYETIASKWGKVMQTNSGTFYEGQLFKVAKKYLPAAKVDVVPFNTQEDIDNYVAGKIYKGSYNGNNVCGTCNFFANLRNVPLLGAFFRWIHSLIHSISTGKNI
ncbi:MAG: cellulase family glycosylhydrolase [Clostridia bacterium]|nr:cellulase family glycosylhydrolase [Clostridia bacterium]